MIAIFLPINAPGRFAINGRGAFILTPLTVKGKMQIIRQLSPM